jgi:hypothetical protein
MRDGVFPYNCARAFEARVIHYKQSMVLEQGGYISLLPLASGDVVFEEDVNLGGGWMSARGSVPRHHEP